MRRYTVCLLITLASSQASFAQDNSNDLKQLGRERIELATKALELASSLPEKWSWSQRLTDAELAMCDSPEKRITALENQLRRTEKIEKLVVDGRKTGAYTESEVLQAKFTRIDNLYKIAQEKAKSTHSQAAK